MLNEIRKKNSNLIIFVHLNINSIRKKFERLKEEVGNKTDVNLISETKLDDVFPLSQFILEGFTPPYRLDRKEHSGGLLIFVREEMRSKLLTYINPSGNFRISLSKSTEDRKCGLFQAPITLLSVLLKIPHSVK